MAGYGDMDKNTPQDEEEGLLSVTRAEIKEIVRREVVASLLSQDWLQDDFIISHLNTAKTSSIHSNETLADKDLDESDLSFESGEQYDTTNINTNDSIDGTTISNVKRPFAADHSSAGITMSPENLQNRFRAIEEQIANGLISVEQIEGKLDMVEEKMERKFEDQGQETHNMISEINNLLTSSIQSQSSSPPPTQYQNRSITAIFNRLLSEEMPDDNFSLMMISTPRSKSWWWGFSTFVFQMVLCILIAINQISQSYKSSVFNVPFQVKREVRVGQFMSILFCVATQSDVLVSIQMFTFLWKSTRWDKPILERGDDSEPLSTNAWVLHILLPNLMRLVEGIVVLFVSFVVIVQSDNIIDLLRDFTVLMTISEVDNLGFRLAASGYIGEEMYHEATKVKSITISERSDRPPSSATSDEARTCDGFLFRPLILGTIVTCMIGAWLWIVTLHVGGKVFHQKFPSCTGILPEMPMEHFGDSRCYGGNMNTRGCEFEDGDCVNFNLEYPLCRGDDLVDVETKLENGICDMAFAIKACGFENHTCCSTEYTNSISFGDGVCDFDKGAGANIEGCQYEDGDCIEYNDAYCSDTSNICCPLSFVEGSSFGDGFCNGGTSALSICNYDNRDCNEFRISHPTCPLSDLATIEGSDNVVLGNNICDSGVYNTGECGWEYGDCAVGQVGQDLLSFDGIITTYGQDARKILMMTKMSTDGSTLAVGMPNSDEEGNFSIDTPGRVQLFYYHVHEKIWMQLGFDLVGDTDGDKFGFSIALNRNGTRIAVGAPGNEQNGPFSGQIKVFDIDATNRQSPFNQVGQSIVGDSSDDEAGWNIDLTADGARLAVAGGIFSSRIQLYDLQEDHSTPLKGQMMEWVQVGEIIRQNQHFGEAIGYHYLYLSSFNGVVVMFSVGFDSVATRVYRFNFTTTDSDSWTRIGYDIQSPFISDNYASSSSAVSENGNRIAITSDITNTNSTGKVEVLDYNIQTRTFVRIAGGLISSPDEHNGFGYSIALSNDGITLAISSVNLSCDGDPNFCATGIIELFAYDAFNKDKAFRAAFPNPKFRNDNIIKEESEDLYESSVFGMKVSLADNADINGITATWLSVHSFNFASEKGYVRVYNLDEQFYPKCGPNTPSAIGNGECSDYPPYNTEACGYDGGDCHRKPVDGYPNCFVHDPFEISNGICYDNPPYNTKSCGYDGGDCSFPTL